LPEVMVNGEGKCVKVVNYENRNDAKAKTYPGRMGDG
jgi:hypothetical protein